MLFGNMIL